MRACFRKRGRSPRCSSWPARRFSPPLRWEGDVSLSDGLELRGLSVGYQGLPVLDEIQLTVGPGEILALLGPNGSGKTTLLRAICGLEPATAGSIRLGGRILDTVPTHRRGIGLLFQ